MLPPLLLVDKATHYLVSARYGVGTWTWDYNNTMTYYSMCHCYPYREDRRWCRSAIDESTPLTRGDVRSEHNIKARAYYEHT